MIEGIQCRSDSFLLFDDSSLRRRFSFSCLDILQDSVLQQRYNSSKISFIKIALNYYAHMSVYEEDLINRYCINILKSMSEAGHS